MKKKKTINEEEQAPHVEPNITVQEEELKICMENQIHKKLKYRKIHHEHGRRYTQRGH